MNNNIEQQNKQQKQQQQNQQQQQPKTSINIRRTNIISNTNSNSRGLPKQEEVIQLPFNEQIKKQEEHLDRPEEDLNINNNVPSSPQTTASTNANKSEKKMMMVSITNLNSKDTVISRV